MFRKCMRLAAAALLVAGLGIASVQGHTVTASGLNVRSGPGLNFHVITTLAHGTHVNTTGQSGSWTKIDSPVNGWVYSAYLSSGSGGGGGGGGSSGGTSGAGFINLPASGYGWYSYVAAYRRWGTPRMVHGLETLGRRWKNGYPGPSGHHLRYGDISLQNGGPFSPHVSHRLGVDVDMSPITTSGNGGPTSVGASSYSLHYNVKFAQLQRSVFNVRLMLHNNSHVPGTTYWPGHADHFHLRIW
ncbi:MAG: penicillin-insensitive murein endopeptidase [Planctomycetes bacterium]|nr:penicillin-insensitive murein endopeptidase [Planctomycetota bacterium]